MSFTAKYDGRCPDCHEVIEAGDVLEMTDDDQAVHEACARGEAAEGAAPREICPRCFIELPIVGTCGVCD